MTQRHATGLLPCVLAVAMAASASALESDQYTVPSTPLADLGPLLSEVVWGDLIGIIEEANAELEQLEAIDEACPSPAGRRWRERRRSRLLDLDHLVRRVFETLGIGFPETRIEYRLVREAEAFGEHGSFRPKFDESIYRSTGFVRPLNVIGLVPTVNMYGTHMGSDKLGHIFQQGREYLTVYRRAMSKGATPEAALEQAVRYGVEQEKGIYGNLPSGVYSNADLAANFAGLQFYLSLTETVRVNGATLPALFETTDDRWRLTARAGERAGQAFLAPFLSEHLNEAMNPARFDWTMREAMRRNITTCASEWLARHGSCREHELERRERLTSWYGASYGHSGFRGVVTVTDVADRPAPAPLATTRQ